jgi:hypothetical protein
VLRHQVGQDRGGAKQAREAFQQRRVAPQQGQRSGKTQFNIIWKMSLPHAISDLSVKASRCTRHKCMMI